jgi:flagellar hook-associated protein 2
MSSAVNSGLFGVNQLYEQLINNLITLESNKKFAYEDQVTEQESRKTAISTVGSKLSSFNTILTEFGSTSNNLFDLYTAKSSNDSAFLVSNTSTLNTSGNYSVEIQQIAKSDVRVTKQFTAADGDIATAINSLTGADELSFDLTISGNTYTISVDDLSGKSNEEVLSAVATAINDTAGTDVQATILRETSSSARLSIRSKLSGADNAISFTNTIDADGETNLAQFLELTVDNGGLNADDNTTVLVGGSTNGGRLFDINTLNAKFTVDGLNFERSSNSVTDAISGLSITLRQVTTGTETLSIESDTASGLDNINRFIDSYNSVITEIRSQSFLNSTSGDRGPLYKDRSFRDLTYTLRQNAVSTALDAAVNIGDPNNPVIPPGTSVQTLLDIGLDFKNDGTIYIKSQTTLTDALESNPSGVATLFANERTDGYSGIAGKLQSSIDLFIKTDGLVKSITSSIDDRIELLNQRIQAQDQFLERRRIQLRDQFIQLQAISDQANSQYQTLVSFGNSYG